MHSLSDRLSEMHEKATEERSDPRAHTSYVAKGQLQVLDEIIDEVFELEAALEKMRSNKSWEDRHSGYGRGDSMG